MYVTLTHLTLGEFTLSVAAFKRRVGDISASEAMWIRSAENVCIGILCVLVTSTKGKTLVLTWTTLSHGEVRARGAVDWSTCESLCLYQSIRVCVCVCLASFRCYRQKGGTGLIYKAILGSIPVWIDSIFSQNACCIQPLGTCEPLGIDTLCKQRDDFYSKSMFVIYFGSPDERKSWINPQVGQNVSKFKGQGLFVNNTEQKSAASALNVKGKKQNNIVWHKTQSC